MISSKISILISFNFQSFSELGLMQLDVFSFISNRNLNDVCTVFPPFDENAAKQVHATAIAEKLLYKILKNRNFVICGFKRNPKKSEKHHGYVFS